MVYGEVADSIQGSAQPLYKRPRFVRAEQWDAYAERLTRFARHTLAHGVRVAYHHHMGAYVEAPADVDRLMSLVGEEVGLLLDSGHKAPWQAQASEWWQGRKLDQIGQTAWKWEVVRKG